MRGLAYLLCVMLWGTVAEASLYFTRAEFDCVDAGTGTSLDNLDPFTIIAWVKRTDSFVSGSRIFGKGNTAGVQETQFAMSSGAGNVRVIRVRTTNTQYVTNDTPLSGTGWVFMAATFDSSNAAGEIVNIYHGDRTTSAVESTYGTTTNGAGALTSDGIYNAIIGNSICNSSDSVFGGLIHGIMVFNRELTLGEIIAQQFTPHAETGLVLSIPLGYYGTGTQADYSGNLNQGTITGATQADPAPIPRFR